MASRNKKDGRVRGKPLCPAPSGRTGRRSWPRKPPGSRSHSRKHRNQAGSPARAAGVARAGVQSVLGKRIRAMRRAKGVPRDIFARRSGISPSLLGQIERGNENFRLLTVLLIAKGLDTTVADLFAGIA